MQGPGPPEGRERGPQAAPQGLPGRGWGAQRPHPPPAWTPTSWLHWPGSSPRTGGTS